MPFTGNVIIPIHKNLKYGSYVKRSRAVIRNNWNFAKKYSIIINRDTGSGIFRREPVITYTDISRHEKGMYL